MKVFSKFVAILDCVVFPGVYIVRHKLFSYKRDINDARRKV